MCGERYGDLRRQNAQLFTHPLALPFAGCLRVTMNFPKIGDTPMCDQFGSAKKYFFDKKNRKIELEKKVREAIWEVRSTPNGREATVTERAARFNPDPFSNAKRWSSHEVKRGYLKRGNLPSTRPAGLDLV